MKTTTTVHTVHKVVLDPEEWFTLKSRTEADGVLEVDRVIAEDRDNGIGDQVWDITVHGHLLLKNGQAGVRRRRWTSWEFTGEFGATGRAAVWDALPAAVRDHLKGLGVTR